MSDVTAAQVHARLQAALRPDALQVVDESASHAGHAGSDGSGHGTHFRVHIQWPADAPASRVAKHRLVYDALSEEIRAGIHALAIENLPH